MLDGKSGAELYIHVGSACANHKGKHTSVNLEHASQNTRGLCPMGTLQMLLPVHVMNIIEIRQPFWKQNVQRWVKRRVKEAIHIRYNQTFNLDCGVYLDLCGQHIVIKH